MAPPSDSTRKSTKERPSKGSAISDAKRHDIASPRKVCKDGETSWAEVDFESDPFVSPDVSIKSVVRKSKSKPSSEKDDEAKAKRTSKGEVKKPSRRKIPEDGDEGEAISKKSSISPGIRSKSKASKTADDKSVLDAKTESSSKLRNKSDTPSSSSRSLHDSPSAVNRRREKAIENGSSIFGSIKHATKPKRDTSSRSCDALETPTRRRVVPIADLASSRTRAVQRADARKSWREAHVPSKESVSGDADDALDAKVQSYGRNEQRANLLDQSRKGPVRISSRMRSRRDEDESDSCYDNDDDDDDFSVISSSSKSFMTNEAPYSNRRVSCAGGYLPNDLNATPSRAQGRRASALGSSLDRAQLIYSLKPKDDDDDDEEKSVYTLPNGLGSAGNITNSQFEIGRSSSNTRARRMSLSTPLVVPCVNGSNTDLTVNHSNEQNQRAEKTERKVKKSSSNDILSLSPSKSSKKSSSKEASGDKTGVDKASSGNTSGHGTYDSAVDDMLKNRRLRGARGDAPTKKVEEKPAVPTNRRMSLGMLTNFVNPNQTADGRARPNEVAMRRPSRI